MKRLKELDSYLESWYKLDYEIKGINYLRVVDNDNDIREYELYFYSDYPVFEEKERYHPLLKRKIIEKKLKNEELFYYILEDPLDSNNDIYKFKTKDIEEILEKFNLELGK